MARRLSPEERRELLGAYALDAVDDDEREQVEELLLDDQEARAEVHALQLGAAWLALAERRPDHHVWERIVGGMQEKDVDGLSAAPFWSRRRVPRLLVGAAVAAAAAVTFVAFTGGFERSPPHVSVARAADAAARNPAARTVALRGSDGRLAAHLVVLPDGRGYLTRSSLPALDTSETYQLWVITPKGPVSAGLLGRAPDVVAFRARAGASRFAVTPEPSGGSRTPTGAVEASGDFASA